MKKSFLVGLLVGLFVLEVIGVSNVKAYTVYHDLASFNVAVGATTTYDFESDTVGITYDENDGAYHVTNAAGMIKEASYSSNINGFRDFGDFTIDATGVSIYMAGIRQQDGGDKDVSVNTMSNTAPMNVIFDQAITAFGFDWTADGNNSWDHSTFILSGTVYDLGTPGDSGFLGVVVDAGENFSAGTLFSFGQISSNWSGMLIDNITYSSIAKPEINLKQGSTNIADGGDHDFGSQLTSSDTDLVFTIENIGTAPLTLTTPITIGGADAGQFSIQAQPTSPVTASGSTTFTVRFSPTTTGAKTATIAIANNDGDENPYDLIIAGTGTTAGITVSALSSTTTNEGGAIATFTVVLDSEPTDDVVVPLSSSDTTEGTVSPASLTFTSSNWSTVQTVTVTGVNDDLLDGDIAYAVEIGPAVSNDSGYDGNNPTDKNLTNNDNDLDGDGDGISDVLEGTGDRDGDGIIDCQDYDPTGYLYDSDTGEIISGGSISVSGPGNVTFVDGKNGADGYYQFVVDQVGAYTITVTTPSGYTLDSTGCTDSGTLTADGSVDPLVLGIGEYGSTGYLADYSCSNNEWYLTINVQDTTPLILNNNIPLEASPDEEMIPTLNEWGMIIFLLLIAGTAVVFLRRRKDVTA